VGMPLSSLIHLMIECILKALSLFANNSIKTDPTFHHSYIYRLAVLRRLLETLSSAVISTI
jgi:hypothetical protein